MNNDDGAPHSYRVREMEIRYKFVSNNFQVPDPFDSEAAARLAADMTRGRTAKIVMALHVSAQRSLLGIQTVAIGSPDWVGFSVSEVLKAALLSNASGFMLASNRVNAGPEPSSEDIRRCNRLVDAAGRVGLVLLDYIIVSEPKDGPWYVSLAQRGYITEIP